MVRQVTGRFPKSCIKRNVLLKAYDRYFGIYIKCHFILIEYHGAEYPNASSEFLNLQGTYHFKVSRLNELLRTKLQI